MALSRNVRKMKFKKRKMVYDCDETNMSEDQKGIRLKI